MCFCREMWEKLSFVFCFCSLGLKTFRVQKIRFIFPLFLKFILESFSLFMKNHKRNSAIKPSFFCFCSVAFLFHFVPFNIFFHHFFRGSLFTSLFDFLSFFFSLFSSFFLYFSISVFLLLFFLQLMISYLFPSSTFFSRKNQPRNLHFLFLLSPFSVSLLLSTFFLIFYHHFFFHHFSFLSICSSLFAFLLFFSSLLSPFFISPSQCFSFSFFCTSCFLIVFSSSRLLRILFYFNSFFFSPFDLDLIFLFILLLYLFFHHLRIFFLPEKISKISVVNFST